MYFFARRVLLVILLVLVSWLGLTALHKHLDPNIPNGIESSEDAKWIATSKHALDRWACKWMGLCGLAHWHPDPATRSWKKSQYARANTQDMGGEQAPFFDWEELKSNGRKMRPQDWKGDARVLKEVPQFVLDGAPLVHLYSEEQFWPSDIAEHIHNMRPALNYTNLRSGDGRHGVGDLNRLNDGRWAEELYLMSKEDVEDRPLWLGSSYNRPVPYEDEDDVADEVRTYNNTDLSDILMSEDEMKDWSDPARLYQNKLSTPFAHTPQAQKPFFKRAETRRGNPRNWKRAPVVPRPGGYSPAPAFLVMVDKGNGILDAFWFYFYSYNLGTTVMKIRFGNHVGDWEHSLIRFHNGKPKAVFFSAHSGGLAYSYDAVEKGKGPGREGRPVLYSAKGSHAMYATAGTHPYILPFGLLADVTDKGPLWDPAQNYIAYHYNSSITHGADSYVHVTGEVPDTPSFHEMAFTIQPALDNPDAPLGWWWYSGHWGDKFYTLGDWRQWRFVGQYHYVNGPYGPRWKNLGRNKVCQSHGTCTILKSLDGDAKRDWLGKRSIDKLGL